jgi:hypothetical protein
MRLTPNQQEGNMLVVLALVISVAVPIWTATLCSLKGEQ